MLLVCTELITQSYKNQSKSKWERRHWTEQCWKISSPHTDEKKKNVKSTWSNYAHFIIVHYAKSVVFSDKKEMISRFWTLRKHKYKCECDGKIQSSGIRDAKKFYEIWVPIKIDVCDDSCSQRLFECTGTFASTFIFSGNANLLNYNWLQIQTLTLQFILQLSEFHWSPLTILWPCNRITFHQHFSAVTFHFHAATASNRHAIAVFPFSDR